MSVVAHHEEGHGVGTGLAKALALASGPRAVMP